MDEKRKGEIAYLVLKLYLKTKGLQFNSGLIKRELGNIAKTTGISYDEMLAFTEGVMREVVDDAFVDAKKNPSAVED